MNEDIVKQAAALITGGSTFTQAEREEIARSILSMRWSKLPTALSLMIEKGVDPEQNGYCRVIDVEKMLCSKLGKEWSATGISIASLIEELAAPSIINLNANVRVKLTEHGKIILAMDEYATEKPDENGFLEMQLWRLMRVFGSVMFMGNPNLPFENMNVELLG